MIVFYKFEAEYYTDSMMENDIDNSICQGIMAAENYIDAVEKLNNRLQHVRWFRLENILIDYDFIFFDDKKYLNSVINQIKHDNSED